MKKKETEPEQPALAAAESASTQGERYTRVFLAALSGYCGNAAMGGAKHEQLAAETAERTIADDLDRHPVERFTV